MATHSSRILLGEFHGQRSLVGYSPQSYKESDTTEQLTVTYAHENKTAIQNSSAWAGSPGLSSPGGTAGPSRLHLGLRWPLSSSSSSVYTSPLS